MSVYFPVRDSICSPFDFWGLSFQAKFVKEHQKEGFKFCHCVSSYLKTNLRTLWESFPYDVGKREKNQKGISPKSIKSFPNPSLVFYRSERFCFNAYYNYSCKRLIISMTKLYLEVFQKWKWKTLTNKFFQLQQRIAKANQVAS